MVDDDRSEYELSMAAGGELSMAAGGDSAPVANPFLTEISLPGLRGKDLRRLEAFEYSVCELPFGLDTSDHTLGSSIASSVATKGLSDEQANLAAASRVLGSGGALGVTDEPLNAAVFRAFKAEQDKVERAPYRPGFAVPKNPPSRRLAEKVAKEPVLAVAWEPV